jgi:hypothetical protein
MKQYMDRILELLNSGMTKADIARQLISENNLTTNIETMRVYVSRAVSKHNNKGVKDACDDVEVAPSNVPYLWLKTKQASLFIKNPSYRVDQIDYESIISKCIEGKAPVPKGDWKPGKTIDRLVWTDVHVGMDASRKGLALYAAEWNESQLIKRVKEMAEFVLANKTSDSLVIDDLGDFMDGWDGETTRKGHKLPQNMTNEEAFESGLKAKVMLIDYLAPQYKNIMCNNICEDNHSGAFGYIVNSAFKHVVDRKYSNVHVINHKRFINHYIIGRHGFIISHGKDSRNLKFGFKVQLDPRSVEKISQYIRHAQDIRSCDYVEFSKGDSHQMLFDYSSSDEFDYFNFPAFSPSSEWVQTNFKKGRSGFVFFQIDLNSNRKVVMPYFFNI